MKKFIRSSTIACAARDNIVSQEDVDELVLYITNDGALYRQMTTPIIENMKRKRKSGKYDDTLAVKGWMHLADEGVRRYDKEFGSGRGSLTMLNKATREAIARELKEYYEDEISYEDGVNSSRSIHGKRKVMAAKVYADGFTGYTPWSGAKDTWYNLEKYGKIDELESYIDEMYYNAEVGEGIIDETELNDLLWFEPELVYEYVGLYYDPDKDRVSDEPFDDEDDDIYSATMTSKYSKQQVIDAIMSMYGYNKTQANAYYKQADEATKQALVEGYLGNSRRSFYND